MCKILETIVRIFVFLKKLYINEEPILITIFVFCASYFIITCKQIIKISEKSPKSPSKHNSVQRRKTLRSPDTLNQNLTPSSKNVITRSRTVPILLTNKKSEGSSYLRNQYNQVVGLIQGISRSFLPSFRRS